MVGGGILSVGPLDSQEVFPKTVPMYTFASLKSFATALRFPFQAPHYSSFTCHYYISWPSNACCNPHDPTCVLSNFVMNDDRTRQLRPKSGFSFSMCVRYRTYDTECFI